jgi:hypothetical protein
MEIFEDEDGKKLASWIDLHRSNHEKFLERAWLWFIDAQARYVTKRRPPPPA